MAPESPRSPLPWEKTRGLDHPSIGLERMVKANWSIYEEDYWAINSVLEGVTRRTIIELATAKGYEVEERTFTRDEVYTSDELFMTGTAAELTPIREVDDRRIGSGAPGPLTRDLQDTFFAVVAGELPEWQHWLVDVPTGEVAESTRAPRESATAN